jgi:hypothetical protein
MSTQQPGGSSVLTDMMDIVDETAQAGAELVGGIAAEVKDVVAPNSGIEIRDFPSRPPEPAADQAETQTLSR